MNIKVCIVCRTSSKRFPAKILYRLNGERIISIIHRRISRIVKDEDIFVLTSLDKSDDFLVDYCEDNHINYFRGSLVSVSTRLKEFSIAIDSDYLIRINGDNLFTDLDLLNRIIELSKTDKFDFISNVKGRTYPSGLSIESIRTRFLQNTKEFYEGASNEHVTSWIYNSLDKVNGYYIESNLQFENLSLALDRIEDLVFLEKLYIYELNIGRYLNTKDIFNYYFKRFSWKKPDGRPMLIAEIGGNHEGNFNSALKLLELAIESGSDVVKFQIYTGDSLVNPILSPDRNKHFKKFELSINQYKELAQICKQNGVQFNASIWSKELLDSFIDDLSFYKIGSGDMTNYPLLNYLTERPKPILLSTGLSDFEEVKAVVSFLRKRNSFYNIKEHICLMQCSSMYPIENSEVNLDVLKLYNLLDCEIGYSDHTQGSNAILDAIKMGSSVIEFHFTDSPNSTSFRDHQVSLTKDQVIRLNQEIDMFLINKGSFIKEPTKSEIESDHVTSFRRGLFLNKSLKKGDTVSSADIVTLRPNIGIDARNYNRIIGKKLRKDITRLEELKFEYFE